MGNVTRRKSNPFPPFLFVCFHFFAALFGVSMFFCVPPPPCRKPPCYLQLPPTRAHCPRGEAHGRSLHWSLFTATRGQPTAEDGPIRFPVHVFCACLLLSHLSSVGASVQISENARLPRNCALCIHRRLPGNRLLANQSSDIVHFFI